MTRDLAEENGKKQSRGRDGGHDRSICREAFGAGDRSRRARGGAGAVPNKKESMTEAVMLSSD
jgi:hypothetical protein